MSKVPEDLRKKFGEITASNYKAQAVWFLNGFWEDGAEKEAEQIWKYANKFIEIDERKKKEGNELDEFETHKFLESLGETLTVVALREKLRKIDLDFNKRVALIEYLTVRYNKDVRAVVNSPQGDNNAQIEEAAQKLEAVQTAYEEVQRQLNQQQVALKAQKKALADSKAASEEANTAANEAAESLRLQKKSEDEVRKAEEELRAAVDELKKQEDSYNKQCSDLEAKSKDSNASTVARSKAANELAQLKGEDPLPLRKAKITSEAKLRPVEKARQAQEKATAEASLKAEAAKAKALTADQRKHEAELSTIECEEQTKRVEKAVEDVEEKVREAEAFLEEAKSKGGVAHGAIWWMQRELKEAQKYLPKSKQTQIN